MPIIRALGSKVKSYFIHNGYSGWSYGTPSDPQLISREDAAEIMRCAKLTDEQVGQTIPAAQYANADDLLFKLTDNNRFICFGDINACMDKQQSKIENALKIEWHAT